MPTQAIAQTLNLAPIEAPSTGDVAARAFTFFDQGMRPEVDPKIWTNSEGGGTRRLLLTKRSRRR